MAGRCHAERCRVWAPGLSGLTPSFGASATSVPGRQAGAPDGGTVSQRLGGLVALGIGDGLYPIVCAGSPAGKQLIEYLALTVIAGEMAFVFAERDQPRVGQMADHPSCG